MMVRFFFRMLGLGGLAVALGGGAFAVLARFWPLTFEQDAVALPGLRIDGVQVPAGADVRGFVLHRAIAFSSRRVQFRATGDDGPRVLVDASFGELGLSLDVDGTVHAALRLGRTGDWLTRARTAARARHGELDVPLEPRFD